MAEPAFAGAGRKPGLELWRIEKLKPVKQAKADGKFYTGDSYILLSTTQTSGGALSWNIHFWLGTETSTDEAGVAAYKTVELDDSLGGGPVQFREVQGFESQQFLSYFKNTGGIQYLPGGIESGFRKVERDVYETRLLHLKGKRTVRAKEVPVQLSSLNKGDVFILDKGLKIFLFNGPSANKFGHVSPTTAQHVRDEFSGDVDSLLDYVLDGGQSEVGIESTILDLSRVDTHGVVLLRPGQITVDQIAAVLGAAPNTPDTAAPRASGTLDAHYAPHTPVALVTAEELPTLLSQLAAHGYKAALMQRTTHMTALGDVIAMPIDLEHYAHDLYAGLREMDSRHAD
eukprot:gene9253-11878_t